MANSSTTQISGSRRGQISIFILIGLVLVATISIAIYVLSSSNNVDTADIGGLDSVDSFVKSCFQGVLDNSVSSFLNQGGLVSDGRNSVSLGSGDIVFYGVKGLADDYFVGNTKILSKSSPDYPWSSFPFKSVGGARLDLNNSFKFGESLVPSTSVAVSDLQRYISTTNTYSKCLDFSKFGLGGISVQSSVPSFVVSLGSSDVSLSVDVTLNASKGSESKKFSGFSVSVPVRLSLLLNVSELVSIFDSEIITYDPNNPFISLPAGFKSFTILGVDNFGVDGKGSDIIEVVDSKAFHGVATKFRFARENRIPALSFIDLSFFDVNKKKVCPGANISVQSLSSSSFVLNFTGYYYNISTPNIKGFESFVLPLESFDPDEDPVSFGIFNIDGGNKNVSRHSNITIPSAVMSNTPFSVVSSDGFLFDYQTKNVEIGNSC